MLITSSRDLLLHDDRRSRRRNRGLLVVAGCGLVERHMAHGHGRLVRSRRSPSAGLVVRVRSHDHRSGLLAVGNRRLAVCRLLEVRSHGRTDPRNREEDCDGGSRREGCSRADHGGSSRLLVGIRHVLLRGSRVSESGNARVGVGSRLEAVG